MKITVEIDEKKLSRLMKLTGIRTKTRALDHALGIAERAARRNKLFETSMKPDELAGAVDPKYDVLAIREKGKARRQTMTYLVDSTIYIDLLRARRDPVRELEPWIDRDEVLTTGIVRCEVLRGVVNSRVHGRMRDLFDILPTVKTDESTWDRTAELAWRLDRRGVVLPMTDLLIASCALRAEAAVVSTDGHFARVPGLMVLGALSAASEAAE